MGFVEYLEPRIDLEGGIELSWLWHGDKQVAKEGRDSNEAEELSFTSLGE